MGETIYRINGTIVAGIQVPLGATSSPVYLPGCSKLKCTRPGHVTLEHS